MHVKRIFTGFFILLLGIFMLAPAQTLRVAGVETTTNIGMYKVTGQVVAGITSDPKAAARLDTVLAILPFILITIGIMTVINSSRLNLP